MTQPEPKKPGDPQRRASRVTSLRAIASRPGWVSVCVDRRRVGAIPLDICERLALRVGAAWTAGAASAFAEEVARWAALHDALAMLRLADRSSVELEQRLRAKGHLAPALGRALDDLRSRGLLDDARTADLTASRGARRGLARPVIEAKLLAAGHDAATAARAASRALSGADPVDEAERLVRGRLAIRPARAGDELRTRRRLLARLSRNGYDQETAARAIARVLGEAPEDAQD